MPARLGALHCQRRSDAAPRATASRASATDLTVIIDSTSAAGLLRRLAVAAEVEVAWSSRPPSGP